MRRQFPRHGLNVLRLRWIVALCVAIGLGGCGSSDPKGPDADGKPDGKAVAAAGDSKKPDGDAATDKPGKTPGDDTSGKEKGGTSKDEPKDSPKDGKTKPDSPDKSGDEPGKKQGDGDSKSGKSKADNDTDKKSGSDKKTPDAKKTDGKGKSSKQGETAKKNPYSPPKGLSAEELYDFILSMLDEPPSEQRQPGFMDGLVEACDMLIKSGESDALSKFAIRAKFKALLMASDGGDEKADKKLVALATEMKEEKSSKIAAYVRLVGMQQRLLTADKLEGEQLTALLADLQKYLEAEKRLTNQHLRLATATVQVINRIDEKQREDYFKSIGQLYAKSVDNDLRNFGARLGKPPEVAGSALAGTKMEITGSSAAGGQFVWPNYRGRVVLVDFWATWCGPCIRELPNVRRVFEKHRDHGFDVVGISLDSDTDKLQDFLQQNDLPWVTLSGDSNQAIATRYGVRGIPTMFLIDKEGKIVAQGHNIGQLEGQIPALLKAKYTPPAQPPANP